MFAASNRDIRQLDTSTLVFQLYANIDMQRSKGGRGGGGQGDQTVVPLLERNRRSNWTIPTSHLKSWAPSPLYSPLTKIPGCTSLRKNQYLFFRKYKSRDKRLQPGTDCHQTFQASKCYLTCKYQTKIDNIFIIGFS